MKRLLRDTLLSALFFALLWGGAPAFATCGSCSDDGWCPSGSASSGVRCLRVVIHYPDGSKEIHCTDEAAPECNFGAPEY